MEPATIAQSGVPKIEYPTVDIRSIKLKRTEAKSNEASRVESMEVDGVDGEVHWTERFQTSFLANYGLSKSVFRLYDHQEVTERIIERGMGDCLRLAVQANTDGSYTALAATRPTKPYVDALDLFEMLVKMGYDTSSVHYTGGVVRTSHEPSLLGSETMKIGGDDLARRFTLEVPLDGWGNPAAYMELIRLVCSNGMIGYAPAFRSDVHIGDSKTVNDGGLVNNPIPTLKQFIKAYNNEEGYTLIRRRLETASESAASLNEFYNLNRLLSNTDFQSVHRSSGGEGQHKDSFRYKSDVTNKLVNLVGADLMEKYGLIALDALPPKRRRVVPVNCTVYDLVNFASEIGTHRANEHQNRRLSAWIGQTLSDSGGYDLENIPLDAAVDHDISTNGYQDLFLHTPEEAAAMRAKRGLDPSLN